MLKSLLALALLTAAAACSKSEEAPASNPPPSTAKASTTQVVTPNAAANADAKAREIFSQRCTPCHGADGRGDGVASKGLTPPPRNFHEKSWQDSVTDEHIVNIIKVGGAGVGKSAAMPGNPDLKDEATLVALKDFIRGLGKQP